MLRVCISFNGMYLFREAMLCEYYVGVALYTIVLKSRPRTVVIRNKQRSNYWIFCQILPAKFTGYVIGKWKEYSLALYYNFSRSAKFKEVSFFLSFEITHYLMPHIRMVCNIYKYVQDSWKSFVAASCFKLIVMLEPGETWQNIALFPKHLRHLEI